MTSLGGGKMGEGKSKMLFFKSGDSAFVAKTVKKAELEYFRKICESYYYHMISHPNTLMSRFYGLYRIAVRGVRIQKISCIAVVEHHIKHTGTCRESCGENSRAGDSNLTTTTSQSIYHHQIENFASTEEKNSNDLCTENGKSKFTRCSVAYRVLGTRL